MKMRLVAFIVLAPLVAGCSDRIDENADISGVQIERDSETCRSTAAIGVVAQSVGDGKSADEKNATYEQSYHACMTARGYSVAAKTP